MTDALSVLRRRAQLLAVPVSVAQPASISESVLCFENGTEQYAIETSYVWRALRSAELTPLPVADPAVLGLFSLQGELLPVFDLAVLLDAPRTAAAAVRPLLVLGRAQPELAVAVAAFGETAQLGAAGWAEPVATSARQSPFVRGVTPDARLLLDGAALLSDARLYIDESSAAIARK